MTATPTQIAALATVIAERALALADSPDEGAEGVLRECIGTLYGWSRPDEAKAS